MARHLEGDIRGKFADANGVIEKCADFLSDSRVQKATNGLAERALGLLPLLYVPNKTEDTYRISGRKFDGQGIPLILTEPYEKVQVRRNPSQILHPRQRDGLKIAFEEVEQDVLTDSQFNSRFEELQTTFIDKHGVTQKIPKAVLRRDAYTYSPFTWICLWLDMDTSNAYLAHTSPIVTGRTAKLKKDNGSLLFHELIHVYQALEGKLLLDQSDEMDFYKYACELEAYSGQASGLEAYTGIRIDGDNPHNWNSYSIERRRRQINRDPDDPFNVSRALLRAIELDDSRLV